MQEWVRQGREKHKGIREHVLFVERAVTSSVGEVDEHFSKESEDLRAEIIRTIGQLESVK